MALQQMREALDSDRQTSNGLVSNSRETAMLCYPRRLILYLGTDYYQPVKIKWAFIPGLLQGIYFTVSANNRFILIMKFLLPSLSGKALSILTTSLLTEVPPISFQQ
jgi:hypothetical protein